jgi:hypothetical protein
MYIFKNNSHCSKYERRDTGQETEEQRTGKRSKGQEQWNRATEKGTLGQLIGVRGRRKEDGIQETDHVRQGTEGGRQGAEQ